ncbi:S8 family serine peptidase [Dactylosporangium sp. CS-047395]|uniref:S8 family serine peptidase n=1 Tax=Dactylosporangium sp. CS-047395 TaxID=3239936 RepID=UPI003D8D497D
MARTTAIGAIAIGLAVVATTGASAETNNPGRKPPAPLGARKSLDLNAQPAKAKSKAATTGKFRAATEGGIQDSYIVVLKNTKATPEQVTDAANTLSKSHHGKVDRVFGKSLRGFSATLTEADAKALANDPNVAYIEQNRVVRKTDTENTKTQSPDKWNLWGLDRIDQAFLPADHRYSHPGDIADVHVYVLDTGVERNDDLAGNHGLTAGWSATWDAEQITACGPMANGADDDGHGTFVATEIAGELYGVAKHTPVESVKVLDCTGEGSIDQVVEGIEHVTATAQKPAVANMSLGGELSQAIDDAVNASIASGITYVVSAGNDGKDACTQSPARVPAAITVGATDATDFRASFSNYGSCLDIFAPGVNIQAKTVKSLRGYLSGTSMAAPLVTGDAVLLLHAHPDWTPAQVRDAIVKAGISGTVRGAGAGSTTKLLRVGEPNTPAQVSLRANANGKIVTADAGGTKPLIANRLNAGSWEGIRIVASGDGVHVGLLSLANNKYITAEAGGNQALIANRTSIGDWEKFTLLMNADGSYSLLANANGKYVTADNGGNSNLIANRTSVGDWEKFYLAGPAATAFLVANANDLAVSADNGGNSPLIANRDHVIGEWETFDVVDAGGKAALYAHANGKYVTAENGGAKALIANRATPGDWEKFTLVNGPDGELAFLANANGRYVTADNGGNSPLIANRTAVGAWEAFWLYTYDELFYE